MKRTLLIFSGLVCVLAFVLPSRVSAQERTVTVQVPANRAWTSTGISLASGQLVQIEATGTVEASSPSDARVFYHQVPPEGRRERHSEKPAPLLPALALLGRIGDGPVLLIGASAQFYAGLPYGTGELQLGINDDLLADNSGSWTVRITVGQGTPPVSSGGQPATPGTTAVSLRGRNGERFSFHCPPNLTAAQVWGTDLYTDDSSICTAAVHAGLITLQHGGAVTIEIRPGAPSYNASSRNGISSGGYGGWSGSYVFFGTGGEVRNEPPASNQIGWDASVTSLRGRNGQRFSYTCPRDGRPGRLWGTDLYTDDSSVCTAAVHAGLISLENGGEVTIEIRPGAATYAASTRRGVTSTGYGAWSGSYVFVR